MSAAVASLRMMAMRQPAPIFGTVGTGLAIGRNKSRAIPRYLPWGVPAVVGALWFIWPAVDEEFKVSIGMSNKGAPITKEEEAP
eukprot:scaffold70888_cov49-Attheya_sp.AAC.2